MKMTKALTMTWIPPTDCVDVYRKCSSERVLKLIEMELDGKTLPEYKTFIVRKNTKQRVWRDQAAVDEWIEFMHYLADKYNGKMVVDEVKDI